MKKREILCGQGASGTENERRDMLNNSTKESDRKKVIRFGSWNKLKRAIPKYEKLGYECEVRGWDDMRFNRLTITDVLSKEAE